MFLEVSGFVRRYGADQSVEVHLSHHSPSKTNAGRRSHQQTVPAPGSYFTLVTC